MLHGIPCVNRQIIQNERKPLKGFGAVTKLRI
jgi:hypothetical protein